MPQPIPCWGDDLLEAAKISEKAVTAIQLNEPPKSLSPLTVLAMVGLTVMIHCAQAICHAVEGSREQIG